MKPGLEFLPRKVRIIVYTIYGCTVLIAIGIDAWFGGDDPAWVEAINRVILAVGAPVMALVAVNVRSGDVVERYPHHLPENELLEPEER
jgi:4-amino-4-deoxy-L-arabinose transferase-like glycosyltransferase